MITADQLVAHAVACCRRAQARIIVNELAPVTKRAEGKTADGGQ
jgi:hypothetical protein